ncbi:putative Fe2OG dioxygenase domain-containing protein [Seiridium cardinale]
MNDAAIEAHVAAYFEYFLSSLPILHRASFDVASMPGTLISDDWKELRKTWMIRTCLLYIVNGAFMHETIEHDKTRSMLRVLFDAARDLGLLKQRIAISNSGTWLVNAELIICLRSRTPLKRNIIVSMSSASATLPQVPKWNAPAPTNENLDYIELMDLDLSKVDDLNARKDLAHDFLKAFTEEGFATISGHGISKETWDQQMDLANAVMTMSPEDKVSYEVTKEEDRKGIYADFYNMAFNDPKSDRNEKGDAALVQQYSEKVPHLACHVPRGRRARPSRLSQAGLIKDLVLPISTRKARGLFMPGHTDWGMFSILFSQSVCALQALHKSGVFKRVQHQSYTLIVNVGQCLELLTGGLFKSTIHRVPLKSPVLEKLAMDKPLDPSVTYSTTEFLKAKKHGNLKPDFDFDKPREEGHEDPFREGETFKVLEKPLVHKIAAA